MIDSVTAIFNLDKQDERNSFRVFYVKGSLPSIRFSLILAFLLYGVFAVLDIYMAPLSKNNILLVRMAIVMPMVVVTYLLTYWKHFIRYSQLILLLISLILGLGIVAIISFTQSTEPAFRYYYAGLILCIIAAFLMFRLDNRIASFASFVMIFGYDAVVFFLQVQRTSLDLALIVNNNFFLISSFILGLWVANSTQRMFKTNYRQSLIIQKEKEDLAVSRHRLEELNGIKSKLISIMSHDIRGPISSIKSILSLYQSNYITEDEFKTYSKQLSGTIDQTTTLLDNLLSWSVLQIQNHKLNKKNVLFRPLVTNVFALLKTQAELKSIQLINAINEDFCVYTEPTITEMVVRNLVNNAIKFTDKGSVEIRSEIHNQHVLVAVRDTGIGIPSEIAANLFNWTKKRSTPGTQSEKGAGIGLLLCKEFIERQGGRLFFETMSNKGTCFYFTIPIAN